MYKKALTLLAEQYKRHSKILDLIFTFDSRNIEIALNLVDTLGQVDEFLNKKVSPYANLTGSDQYLNFSNLTMEEMVDELMELEPLFESEELTIIGRNETPPDLSYFKYLQQLNIIDSSFEYLDSNLDECKDFSKIHAENSNFIISDNISHKIKRLSYDYGDVKYCMGDAEGTIFSKMSNCITLSLIHMNMSELPNGIYNMQSLRKLDISDNKISNIKCANFNNTIDIYARDTYLYDDEVEECKRYGVNLII